MTFHSRSVVEFGRFFSRFSESVLAGDALADAAELIRRQFSAVAVALRFDDPRGSSPAPVILVEAPDSHQDERSPSSVARLAELMGSSRQMSASAFSEADGGRSALWVFRDPGDADFDGEERALCEIVAEQLLRGVEHARRVRASEIERALYSAVMDKLSVGVVILDLCGRVVKCSSKAEESLAGRDGLQLQAGRLRATCAAEDRELQAAIKAAVQAATTGDATPSRGLALTKPSGARNLGVIVQPAPDMKRAHAAGVSSVAIYIRDPEANADVESDLVRQLFDLTPAEAAVARRLTAGLSLEDAANSLDISRNTARAHLRSIFSKSGITRQTELVRLMLNSAAVLGERPRQIA